MSFSVSQSTILACTVPIGYFTWKIGGNYLYSYFENKSTVLNEIKHIGKPRPDNKRIAGTAVVCGGSIAGLWTARVLADHYEDVLIIEPEAWTGQEIGRSNAYTADGEPIEENATPQRSRVMQYNTALHVYQPMAYYALKKYFPNFDDEVRSANGRIQEFEVNAYAFGRKFAKIPEKKHPSDDIPTCFWLSRDAYERVLRRLVLSSSNRVRWMTGTVTGLQTDVNDLSKISSAVVRLDAGNEVVIPATLVVDCSGRSQVGLKWLRRLSTAPENAEKLKSLESVSTLPWDKLRVSYNCDQRSVTFHFWIPPEARNALTIPGGYENNVWPYTYITVPGKENLLYIISRTEGHRVNMAFSGYGPCDLPETFDDIIPWFHKFESTHSKVPEWIYKLVDQLLDLRRHAKYSVLKNPDQSWIFWESAPYVPSNFLAIGDSVMTVNPTYGQGCSKAAMGAMTLDGMLREIPNATCIPSGFGRKFFKIHNKRIVPLWDGTKPTDYLLPATKPIEGEKLSDEWLKGNLGNLVLELAGLDEGVDKELFNVRFFLAPPESLFKPHLLLKYAMFALRKRLGLAPSA